jgi:MFS family permease
VILLAHEFNAVKTYIIRDHGFWAFYVVSILFLLYYFHTRRAYYAFLWSASVIVAALFRIEGAIFLLAVPFISWLEVKQTWATRLKTFLQLNAGVFIVSFIAAGYFLFYPTHSVSGRLPELQFQLLHGLTLLKQNFQLKEAGLATIVLGTNGARDAAAVLTLTLLTWYVLNVIVNLSLIYTGLFIYSGWNRLLTATQTTRLVLWGYIITNVVVTALFLAQNMFLSKRYLIALSLVLMLWVPFALAHLMQQWDRRKWPFVLVMLFIIFSSLGGIFDFGYSKQYVRDAGEWLALHVPSKALVYSNDLQLMYYSKHFGSQQLFIQAEAFSHPEALAQSAWKKYDYLAVRVDQKQLSSAAGILHEIQKTEVPIQVFRNKRGDQVRIYRRKP